MTEQLMEGERNLKAQMENFERVLAAEEKMKQMLGG